MDWQPETDCSLLTAHCSLPIAVVAALEDEIKSLRARLSGAQRLPLAGLTSGTWRRLPLLLVRTGLGPAAAARTLRRVLIEFSPGFCLQVGYAGAARPDLQPGDLVMATTLIDAANGLSFAVAPQLVAQADLIRNRLELAGRPGPLVTVAQAALTPNDKADRAREHQALALDMESAVLAGACKNAAIPFLVVRAILDPLDFHLPEMGRKNPPRPNPFKSPPLSNWADLARRNLTAFTAAWLDEISGQWSGVSGQ